MSMVKRKLAKNFINSDLNQPGIHSALKDDAIIKFLNFLPILSTSRSAFLKTIIGGNFYHLPLQQGTQKREIFHNQLI